MNGCGIQYRNDSRGVVRTKVSGKTDYLIVGTQDKQIVGESGHSTSERDAEKFKAPGAKIKILTEDDFLNMFL